MADAVGYKIDISEFVRALGEEVATNISRDTKSAMDAFRGRRMIGTWVSPPTSDLVRELFHTALKTHVTILNAQQENALEDDARALAYALEDAAEARNLRECARIVFTQIADESFLRFGKRIRMLIAPWLGARLLGLRRATIPVALTVNQEVDAAKVDEPAALARALEKAARRASDGLTNVRLLRDGLLKEYGDRNAKSKAEDAVDFFVTQPMASSRDIEKALGLSRRGANFVIDRLLQRGVIENVHQDRAKNRVFACRRAMVL
ncbi:MULTISPECIES: hypothetical protein [unclassified Bradyrhizobium]